MITGRQIREARAMLGWTSQELAIRAQVTDDVMARAEAVSGTPSITLNSAARIQGAFERAGVRFGRNGAVMRVTASE